MKKKAGQASAGESRGASVRNTSLAPVNYNSDKQLAVSKSEAPKTMVAEEASFEEFDYKSLGRANNEKSSKPAAKKPAKASAPAKKTSSAKSEKTSKAAKKAGKKRKSLAPLFAVILGILIIGIGIFAGLYYTGFFKPKIAVTLADGTSVELKAEEAYAELMTDKFYQGIVIDGIDVGGMTKAEALAAVSATLPEKPMNVDIRLDLTTVVIPVDFSDAGFAYNTEEIVDKAFDLYRPTDANDFAQITECYNGVQQLKNAPATYETAYTVKIEGVSQKIHSVLDPLYEEYARVENAQLTEFDVETCEFTVSPEKIGYEMDIEKTITDVKNLLDSKVYSGLVKVPMTVKEPELTEQMIRDEFGCICSVYTVAYNNSNRNNNINQACVNINGTILQPGEVFSFNGVVGQRTVANGFKEAGVILNGQVDQGLGGGICQVSSTLYNAVLMANLTVVERSAHAWPSDYLPAGLDATVDWPALDFKFENSSDFQIVIVTYFDWSDNTIVAEIYGKKLPDGQHIELESEIVSTVAPGDTEYVEDKTLPTGQSKTVRTAHNGTTAKAYKVWYDKDGNVINREEYNSTYYSPFPTRVAVGTLNPDGTYATFDKTTGEITSPIMTPTPTPSPSPVPATATPTPEPATPTPEPPPPTTPPEPATPTPDTGNGGGEGGNSGEGGGGSTT